MNFDFVVESNLRGIEMIVTQAGPTDPPAPAQGLAVSGSARKIFAPNEDNNEEQDGTRVR